MSIVAYDFLGILKPQIATQFLYNFYSFTTAYKHVNINVNIYTFTQKNVKLFLVINVLQFRKIVRQHLVEIQFKFAQHFTCISLVYKINKKRYLFTWICQVNTGRWKQLKVTRGWQVLIQKQVFQVCFLPIAFLPASQHFYLLA